MEKYIVNYWIRGKKHKGGDFISAKDASDFAQKVILKMDDKKTPVTKVEIYHQK